jgi:divalent metal cation (Fe/Co/Zn/Cd) transporter
VVSSRSDDMRAAARACGLTVAWNVLAGGAAIVSAVAVGSLSLAGFGINAALDSVASATLVWQFRTESKNSSRRLRLEAVTVRIVGLTLIAVACYIAIEAIVSLRAQASPDTSPVPLVIAGSSLLVLPPLARSKLRLSRRLSSRALRGDAMLTAIGCVLAALAIVGLALNAWLGWWWTDGVAALVMSALLLREARLTLRAPQHPLGTNN